MPNVYVETIKSEWKDDVGGVQSRAVSQCADRLNAEAEQVNEVFYKVENSQRRQLNFQPRSPKIEEIKESLQWDLDHACGN